MRLPAAAAALCARLGHDFARPELLAEALTHGSASSSARPDNQRLEFLGDRVLGLVIAEALLDADASANVGRIAPRLNELVRRETCADVARELRLGDALAIGKPEMKSGGRRKDTLLADAMEAVVAAVYLDGGFEAARGVVLRAWGRRAERVAEDARDAKSSLQEWAQARGLDPPGYALLSRSGPDHAPVFEIEARLGTGAAETASAGSRRRAEQEAAERLLRRVAAREPPARGGA